MLYLDEDLDVPILLPESYHHLLSVYTASRLFGQDERYHQESKLMNEFEVKLHTLLDDINSGDVVIVDENGDEVTFEGGNDYVRNVYFNSTKRDDDDEEELIS
ncbi:hypothetical protein D3C78_1629590 [compost metagenome]